MVKIRSMKHDDVTAAVSLALGTRELHDYDTPSYLSEENLRAFIASEHDVILSLVEGKRFLGFVLCPYHPLTKIAYLQDIVVAEGYRSKGYGGKLYNAAIEILLERGCESIWALVHGSNVGMSKFLKARNFEAGRSFTLMEKDLRPKKNNSNEAD